MTGFEIFMLVSTILSSSMSVMQAQQQKKAQEKAAQQAADQAAKDKWDAYEKAEKQRKENLRKALAKKRARMGASGLSAADGSAGAIVQGMRNDASEETYNNYQDSKEEIADTISGLHSNLLNSSRAANRKIVNEVGGMASTIGGSLVKAADKNKKEEDTSV